MTEIGAVRLPLRTGRGQNDRMLPQAKARLTKVQRKAGNLAAFIALSPRDFPEAKLRRMLVESRFVVGLCRCTPSALPLDDDNAAGALKGVRDGVADRLFVNDGDRRLVRWVYTQKTSTPWAVEIEIHVEPRDA